ncbi:MAG: hypothetical protein JWL87_35 [Candidatus Adlerbacteria bacterium]|nr:hypothetical protein [Candidatus Adlerbacteria bacterium]
MKKYLDHIKTKEPHERRQHAMQIAGVVTAGVFAIWITTLGFRLSSDETQLAQDDTNQTSLTAAAAQSGYNGPNQLIPAPTSGF